MSGGETKMEILKDEKAQGATEYLLILAGVLAVIVIAFIYVRDLAESGENAAKEKENQLLENILSD